MATKRSQSPKKAAAQVQAVVGSVGGAKSSVPLMSEVAVADPRYGFANSGFYTKLRYNPDHLVSKRGLKIYTEMRRDEQVKAALSTKKLAAVASGWEIAIADEALIDDKDHDKQKRFVEFCLGEMQGTVEKWLMDALTAMDYGYSLTEPVYQYIDYGEFKGQVGLKALKVKRPEQIDFETDQFGNLTENGVLQANRPLPASRFAIYSYRSEFGNFYGNSDLQEAYRPWFIKTNLMKFMAMALERYGQPIAVATTDTTMSDPDKALLLGMINNLQARTGILIPSSIKLVFEQPSPRTSEAFIPALNKLDNWIAMAILMPSLLGMGGGAQAQGSLARSETEFDTFLWVVDQLRKDLAAFANDQVIKVLLDINFDITEGIYPVFKFKELTEDRKQKILDAYNKALNAGAVTKTREDEEFYRSTASLPELPDEVISAGTREAKEREVKDEAAQAKAMPTKPALFHLTGEHDQEDHGNRGGGLVDQAIKKGGFTYNPVRLKGRTSPKNGFALSVAKNTEKVINLDRDLEQVRNQLKSYVREHWDKIESRGNFLGGWIDGGKLYLDISNVVKNKAEAITKAEKANQLTIFDLGKGETINVLKKAA